MIWRASEVALFGEPLVEALTDTLWYINGHIDVLECRSCRVPSIFHVFQGSSFQALLT